MFAGMPAFADVEMEAEKREASQKSEAERLHAKE